MQNEIIREFWLHFLRISNFERKISKNLNFSYILINHVKINVFQGFPLNFIVFTINFNVFISIGVLKILFNVLISLFSMFLQKLSRFFTQTFDVLTQTFNVLKKNRCFFDESFKI